MKRLWFVDKGYLDKRHAWLAYQIWLTQKMLDANALTAEVKVKLTRAPNGTWSVEASVVLNDQPETTETVLAPSA